MQRVPRLVAAPILFLARIADVFERRVVDGAADAVGRFVLWLSGVCGKCQTGDVRLYGAVMVIGTIVLVVICLCAGKI